MRPVERLLPLLDKVRQTHSGQWIACCPAHDDRSPSLGVLEAEDGKLVMNCLAGCDITEILSVLGMAWPDLFPDNPTPTRTKRPYWNPKDLLAVRKDEFFRLACGWGRFRRGETLSDQDLERMDLACERILKMLEVQCLMH